MSTLDEITKEKQRVSEALARVDAQRERLASQLNELEATERVLARYSKGTPARRTASSQGAHRGQDDCSGAVTWSLAHNDRSKASGSRPHLVEPPRSDPCRSKRQDAAGNCSCMPGASRQSSRYRHRPAKAGGPHRRARG